MIAISVSRDLYISLCVFVLVQQGSNVVGVRSLIIQASSSSRLLSNNWSGLYAHSLPGPGRGTYRPLLVIVFVLSYSTHSPSHYYLTFSLMTYLPSHFLSPESSLFGFSTLLNLYFTTVVQALAVNQYKAFRRRRRSISLHTVPSILRLFSRWAQRALDKPFMVVDL